MLNKFFTSYIIINGFLQDLSDKAQDPFYESQENHNLIGVANIFLEALFHDVTLDYHTPIISQQGEVAGRLQVINFNLLKINLPHLIYKL